MYIISSHDCQAGILLSAQIWHLMSLPTSYFIICNTILAIIIFHYISYRVLKKEPIFIRSHIILNIVYKCIVILCGFIIWSGTRDIEMIYNFISFCQFYLLYNNIVLLFDNDIIKKYTKSSKWFNNDTYNHILDKMMQNALITFLIKYHPIKGRDHEETFMIILVLLAVQYIPYDYINYIIVSKIQLYHESIKLHSFYITPVRLLIVYISYPYSILLIFAIHNLYMGLRWECKIYNFLKQFDADYLSKQNSNVCLVYEVTVNSDINCNILIDMLKMQCPNFDIICTVHHLNRKKLMLKCYLKYNVDMPIELTNDHNRFVNIIPKIIIQLIRERKNELI